MWVGFDDNQPIGLSGAQAALPIWTQFMKAALAGRPSIAFDVPEGITFADIDPETGKLVTPRCPKSFNEAFFSGTEPTNPVSCTADRWAGLRRVRAGRASGQDRSRFTCPTCLTCPTCPSIIDP